MSTEVIFGVGTTPQAGGTIPAEVRQAYATRLLLAAIPDMKHAQFMENEDIPKNTGTTMIFRRFELLPVTTTALTEGVTPGSDTPVVTPVSIGIAQYGRWVPITDLVSWASIDKVMVQITKQQGTQSGRTIDQLARTVMTGGTNIQYANGRTSKATVTSGDKMTAIEIKKAFRTLDLAFVDTFDDGCFVAIISPYVVFDIEAMAEWLTPHEYASGQQDALYKGEIGMLFGVRFVKSNQAVIFSGAGSGGIDVYGTVVFGPNAFLKSTISGQSLEQIIKPLGAGEDPMNQRQTTAWKGTWGGTIANQTFCVLIISAAST